MTRVPKPGDRFALPGDLPDKVVAAFVCTLDINGETRYLVRDETGGQWVLRGIEESIERWEVPP